MAVELRFASMGDELVWPYTEGAFDPWSNDLSPEVQYYNDFFVIPWHRESFHRYVQWYFGMTAHAYAEEESAGRGSINILDTEIDSEVGPMYRATAYRREPWDLWERLTLQQAKSLVSFRRMKL